MIACLLSRNSLTRLSSGSPYASRSASGATGRGSASSHRRDEHAVRIIGQRLLGGPPVSKGDAIGRERRNVERGQEARGVEHRGDAPPFVKGTAGQK
jgi:hypothetical protein